MTPAWKENPRSALQLAALAAKRLAFGLLALLAIIALSQFGLSLGQGRTPQIAIPDALLRTASYVARLVRGDLGYSLSGTIALRPEPIPTILWRCLPKSLGLIGFSVLLAVAIGALLGLLAARFRYSSWSFAILFLSVMGISLPSFFVALLLQLGAIWWGRAQGRMFLPVGGFGWDRHIVLPALVLAARPIAQIARTTLVAVSHVLDQDYVRTARGKGLYPRNVWRWHILPNIAIPVLTTIGLSIRFALSSLPVVEFFFGWPGVGLNLLKGIARRDENLTVALFLCLGAAFILINAALDLAYRLIDPRLRADGLARNAAEHESVSQFVRAFVSDVLDGVAHSQVWRRLKGLPRAICASARQFAQTHLKRSELKSGIERRRPGVALFRARGYELAERLFFLAGCAFVVALLLLAAFGPRLAPHSPYTTQGLTSVAGELVAPPFAPSGDHPWGADVIGRDIMSLVLAGAQHTLLLAALAMLARLAVGCVLGLVAGWLAGSWVDQALLRASEIIAAFPVLLLCMLFILALDVRQGLPPFIIALCLVGWGEIMQTVRSQALSLRVLPFVESAQAIGLRSPQILVRHVLPNLVSTVLAVAALEMGAVLMLLGELGFIGIFIGGGAFAETTWLGPVYHYSDVPEWGALLSNIRTYGRSHPWMAIYPSLAFFVAILAFNLFGETVRRLVERARIDLMDLIRRYVAPALVLLTVVGIAWSRGNLGAVATYRGQAETFDGTQAMAHVRALAAPAMQGRAMGAAGLGAAADLIAAQFEALGVQPAGEGASYFQTCERSFLALGAAPTLTVDDNGPALVYHRDFAEYPGRNSILGSIQGQVRYLAMGELSEKGEWAYRPLLANKNYEHEIIMVSSARDANLLDLVPCGAVLVIAGPDVRLDARHTLSTRLASQDGGRPMLWVAEATANRLLQGAGSTASDLALRAQALGRDEEINLPTGHTAAIEVQGAPVDAALARHVIGYIPGKAASIEGRRVAEAGKLDNRLVVVMAQYDSPPLAPEQPLCPAANDNASGVAVMLEVIRAMRDAGYQPAKTMLFVAYSGEGLEGGERIARPPEVARILQARPGFSSAFQLEAIVELRGLGAGQGDQLLISTGGSTRLAKLAAASARFERTPARLYNEAFDISLILEDRDYRAGGQEAPTLLLTWEGWETTSRLPADAVDRISPHNLERAGRAVALMLMIMGRETQY